MATEIGKEQIRGIIENAWNTLPAVGPRVYIKISLVSNEVIMKKEDNLWRFL